MDTWDSLKPGNFGQFAFMRIDIVDHSRISNENPTKQFEKIFDAFGDHFEKKVKRWHGRLWYWAGDGGLVAFFRGKNITEKVESATATSFSILSSLSTFNGKHKFSNSKDKIMVRIAIHPGNARYREIIGRIHSTDINFVSHLEARRTHPNSISISEEGYNEIRGHYGNRFVPAGSFENHNIYTTDKKKAGKFTVIKEVERTSQQSLPVQVRMHDITVVLGRNDSINLITTMFEQADKGDIIFGGCRTCKKFGNNFFQNLRDATEIRRATAEILIPLDAENKSMVKSLLNIKRVTVKNGEVGPLRLIGILGKEIALVFPQKGEESYVTLHTSDGEVSNYIYESFKRNYVRSKL